MTTVAVKPIPYRFDDPYQAEEALGKKKFQRISARLEAGDPNALTFWTKIQLFVGSWKIIATVFSYFLVMGFTCIAMKFFDIGITDNRFIYFSFLPAIIVSFALGVILFSQIVPVIKEMPSEPNEVMNDISDLKRKIQQREEWRNVRAYPDVTRFNLEKVIFDAGALRVKVYLGIANVIGYDYKTSTEFQELLTIRSDLKKLDAFLDDCFPVCQCCRKPSK